MEGNNAPQYKGVRGWLERVYGSETLPLASVVAIILPLFVDQLFVCVVNLLNTTMISSYGTTAVSAVSIVDSLNNFVINFFIAVATGCTVLVAQYCGKGDRHTANEVAAQAVGTGAYLSLILGGIILVFAVPIVKALFGDTEQAVLDQAVVYMRGCAISYPFHAILQTVVGAMRGAGNTRTSLYFTLMVNASYLALNGVMLYGLGLGVLGMTIALNTARIVTATAAVLYMVRSNRDFRTGPALFLKPNPKIQKPLLFLAIPAGLEQVFFHGGRMLTQLFIVPFGLISTTVNGVCTPINAIQQVIGNSMVLAIVPMAGQCVGAKDIKQAKSYVKRITLTAIVGMAVTSLVMAPLIPLLLRVFNLPDEGYGMALRLCLMMMVVTPLTWPASFVVPAGLRAAGDVRFTSLAAMLSMWSVRVVLGYILSTVLGFGLFGVWAAMMFEWCIRSAVFLLRLRGTRWFRHRLV